MIIRLSLVIIFIMTTGCSTIQKYLDESTHYCTHEKDGKKKGPFPVKLKKGMDTVWEEDGWKISCVPME